MPGFRLIFPSLLCALVMSCTLPVEHVSTLPLRASPRPSASPSRAPSPASSQVPSASPSEPGVAVPSPLPSVQLPTNVLLRVETSGGLCVYGGCHSELEVQKDGSYTYTVGPDDPVKGIVARGDVDALAQEIQKADFAAIESVKFTDMCPTAVDGSEFTYSFNAPQGAQSFSSCQVKIDDNSPLFQAVEKVVQDAESH